MDNSTKQPSLRQIMTDYAFGCGKWINGGEFERLAIDNGYKASNASRRLREMESGKLSDGRECPKVLENIIRDGSVWYKYLEEPKGQGNLL